MSPADADVVKGFLAAFSAADFAGRGLPGSDRSAAHLLRVADGVISEWWMVDAKPAESDSFWS